MCHRGCQRWQPGTRSSHWTPSGITAAGGGLWAGGERPDGFAFADDPVSAIPEHGRGLKIIDAVADNLQLTGNQRQGTTLHFEKTLEWLPGAAGPHRLTPAAAPSTRLASQLPGWIVRACG